jgi:hypothetical protein
MEVITVLTDGSERSVHVYGAAVKASRGILLDSVMLHAGYGKGIK